MCKRMCVRVCSPMRVHVELTASRFFTGCSLSQVKGLTEPGACHAGKTGLSAKPWILLSPGPMVRGKNSFPKCGVRVGGGAAALPAFSCQGNWGPLSQGLWGTGSALPGPVRGGASAARLLYFNSWFNTWFNPGSHAPLWEQWAVVYCGTLGHGHRHRSQLW